MGLICKNGPWLFDVRLGDDSYLPYAWNVH